MGGLASSGDIALSRDSWRPASTAAWRSALLLVGGTTVALQANRGGRRRGIRAWMTKAHVEGHVDTASIAMVRLRKASPPADQTFRNSAIFTD